MGKSGRQVRPFFFAMSFLPKDQSLNSFQDAMSYGDSVNGWIRADLFFKKLVTSNGIAFDKKRNVIGFWNSPEPSIIASSYALDMDCSEVSKLWIDDFEQEAVIYLEPSSIGDGGFVVFEIKPPESSDERNRVFDELYEKMIQFSKQGDFEILENQHLGFSFLFWDIIEIWFNSRAVGEKFYNLMSLALESCNIQVIRRDIITGYDLKQYP